MIVIDGTFPKPSFRPVRQGVRMALLVLPLACGAPPDSAPTAPSGMGSAGIEIKLVSEVAWEPLNPARGDASPRAADLWGDRKVEGATGFLVRFVDGFSSPPHIHNVTYRGIVLRGLVHNGAPEAPEVWMPTASFWTQPKGGLHITSARGVATTAYIEIEKGPYLVRPPDRAFDTDETALNLPASEVVWSDQGGRGTALLWGNEAGRHGRLVAFGSGSQTEVRGAAFRAVVVAGDVAVTSGDDRSATVTAPPGSYVRSRASSVSLDCLSGRRCVVYVRAEGKVRVGRFP